MITKYQEIYEEIAGRIERKELKTNEKLPSEKDLMSIYHVSRDTIRKALNLLSQNGYVQKIKGKGSIILDINKFDFPVTGIVSFKELSNQLGQDVKTHVKKLKLIKADRNISQLLEVPERSRLWDIMRVREINGEKIILDKDFILKSEVDSMTEEICRNSIYEYFEQDLELKIGYAKKEITVEPITREDKLMLDMAHYDMIVVVKSLVYLNNTKLFQYTESRHRPDKFRFTDFARRSV